jgi:spermidine/putrescine transport system permease protein
MRFLDKKKQTNTKPLFLISPVVLILLVLVFLPLIVLILFSFHPDAPDRQHVWTLENYLFVFFENPTFYKVLFWTILISAYTVVITLLICFPIAYYIAKVARKEHKTTLVLIVIAPNMVSVIIIVLAWLVSLADYGVFYHVLKSLRLIKQPLHILYTKGAVTIGLTYISILWMFMPLYTVFESLDYSLIEAAQDLGAGNWRILFRIIVPYAKTAISTGCTLTFLGALGSYLVPRFLGGKSGLMYVWLVFDSFYMSYNWNRGAVLAIFMIFIMIIIVFFGIKATGTSIRQTIKF